MTRLARMVLIASALALPLGGCGSMAGITDSLDPSDWFSTDFFNTKKKLPGERKPVFPEGVPGVAQGIPRDLVKGNQPPPDVGVAGDPQVAPQVAPQAAPARRQAPATRQAGATSEEFQPAPREKAKPKPKPQPQQATTERPPTAVTVRRSPDSQQQQQQQQQPASAASPWPDPPAPRSSQPGAIQWPDPPPVR